MFTKKLVITSTLLSSLFVGTNVNAQEEALEQFLSHMVSHTVASTKQEIAYGVQEAVLTATHMFDVNADQETLLASVKITDLSQVADVNDK